MYLLKLMGKMVMEERHVHLREVGVGELLDIFRGLVVLHKLRHKLILCGIATMTGSSSGDGRFHRKKETGKAE